MTSPVERVGYLGSPGTYSQQAAVKMSPGGKHVGLPGFQEILSAVLSGDLDAAILPVDNAITGRIPQVHPLLRRANLQIHAEAIILVEHCLVGLASDVALAEIEEVISHEQGLLQCSSFLDRELARATRTAVSDTARGAIEVAARGKRSVASISSGFAAEVHGCSVLRRDISEASDNATRFFLLKPGESAQKGGEISTFFLRLDHRPGALASVLNLIARHEANLLRLETFMPTSDEPYPAFMIDIGLGLRRGNGGLLEGLSSICRELRVMGTYPAAPERSWVTGFLAP
jgi:prephenate dehydratase